MNNVIFMTNWNLWRLGITTFTCFLTTFGHYFFEMAAMPFPCYSHLLCCVAAVSCSCVMARLGGVDRCIWPKGKPHRAYCCSVSRDLSALPKLTSHDKTNQGMTNFNSNKHLPVIFYHLVVVPIYKLVLWNSLLLFLVTCCFASLFLPHFLLKTLVFSPRKKMFFIFIFSTDRHTRCVCFCGNDFQAKRKKKEKNVFGLCSTAIP